MKRRASGCMPYGFDRLLEFLISIFTYIFVHAIILSIFNINNVFFVLCDIFSGIKFSHKNIYF